MTFVYTLNKEWGISLRFYKKGMMPKEKVDLMGHYAMNEMNWSMNLLFYPLLTQLLTSVEYRFVQTIHRCYA